MAGVTTMRPMLQCIEEVCCDGAGLQRTLATDYRFRRGPYPDQKRTEQGTEAAVQKGMYVSVDRAEPMQMPEMHDVLSYALTVRLDAFYHIPDPQLHTALLAILAEASTDVHRLRMALGYPGNLQTNAAGESTGLSGSALQFTRWTMRDPETDARVIRATMQLTGRINMTA